MAVRYSRSYFLATFPAFRSSVFLVSTCSGYTHTHTHSILIHFGCSCNCFVGRWWLIVVVICAFTHSALPFDWAAKANERIASRTNIENRLGNLIYDQFAQSNERTNNNKKSLIRRERWETHLGKGGRTKRSTRSRLWILAGTFYWYFEHFIWGACMAAVRSAVNGHQCDIIISYRNIPWARVRVYADRAKRNNLHTQNTNDVIVAGVQPKCDCQLENAIFKMMRAEHFVFEIRTDH